jgi:hypothetical protein
MGFSFTDMTNGLMLITFAKLLPACYRSERSAKSERSFLADESVPFPPS